MTNARLTAEHDLAKEQVRYARQRADAGLTGQVPVAEAVRRLADLTALRVEATAEAAVQQDMLAIPMLFPFRPPWWRLVIRPR